MFSINCHGKDLDVAYDLSLPIGWRVSSQQGESSVVGDLVCKS